MDKCWVTGIGQDADWWLGVWDDARPYYGLFIEEPDAADGQSDLDRVDDLRAVRGDDNEPPAGQAVGRNVQAAAVGADPHVLRGRSGLGWQVDRVHPAGRGVQNGDVGVADAVPAGVDILAVGTRHQVAHAQRQRMRRDDGVGRGVDHADRVIRR